MDPWWWTVSWASHFGARSCGTANINGLAAPLANASHLFKRSDERSESETLIRPTSCPNIPRSSSSKYRRSCDYLYVCTRHWTGVDFSPVSYCTETFIPSGYFLCTRCGSCPRNFTTFK